MPARPASFHHGLFFLWCLHHPLHHHHNAAEAARLPLAEGAIPYLNVGNQNEALRWNDASTLYSVQRALVVEIAPRGLRFVYQGQKMTSSSSSRGYQLKNSLHSIGIAKDLWCEPQPGTMCCMSDGCFIPSSPYPAAADHSNDHAIVSSKIEGLSSDVLKAYADASFEACSYKENGIGRTYYQDDNMSAVPQYTVSACDILQGHFVAMYYPVQGKILLFRQTFGPVAYTAVLVAALVCLYHCATSIRVDINNNNNSSPAEMVCMPMTIGLALLFLKIPLPTVQDEFHFWLSMLSLLLMSALSVATNSRGRAAEACMYALIVLADAVYRTPENPYAGIVCFIFCIRQWQRVLTLQTPLEAVELVLTTCYMCITVELGWVPQFKEAEHWPIYGATGTYAAFALAWYKLHLKP